MKEIFTATDTKDEPIRYPRSVYPRYVETSFNITEYVGDLKLIQYIRVDEIDYVLAMESVRMSEISTWCRVKVGLHNANRSTLKSSLGLSRAVMYHQTFSIPYLCRIIKENRAGTLKLGGVPFETKLVQMTGGGGGGC